MNSHVGLDCDSIYTIILLFSKNFWYFFPFGIVLLFKKKKLLRKNSYNHYV